MASTNRHVPLEGQPNFRDLGGYEAVGTVGGSDEAPSTARASSASSARKTSTSSRRSALTCPRNFGPLKT